MTEDFGVVLGKAFIDELLKRLGIPQEGADAEQVKEIIFIGQINKCCLLGVMNRLEPDRIIKALDAYLSVYKEAISKAHENFSKHENN